MFKAPPFFKNQKKIKIKKLGIFRKVKKIKKEYLAATAFLVLVFLFYGNTLLNGFVQDDVPQIEKNIFVHSLKYLPKMFTGCLWEYANKGCKGSSFYYRPLLLLNFMLVYQISSQPWFFHLVNLLYLWAAICLIFFFVRTLTKDFLLSFITGLIFLTHPINSEVVNWICAEGEIIFLSCVLLGCLAYLKYRQRGDKKNHYLVYLLYFIGLLFKETAAFYPLIILSLDLFILKTKLKKFLTWPKIKEYLWFGPPFLIYYLMRQAVIGSFNLLGNFRLTERIYAFISLLAKYIAKEFYPYPLLNFYNFQIKADFGQPIFFLYLLLFLLFFGLLIYFIKKKENLLAFCFSWFIIFLLPPMIFLQAAGAGNGTFFERYAFASTFGFSMAISFFLCRIIKIEKILAKKDWRAGLLILLIITVFTGSWLIIFHRNKDWRNNETIFLATLGKNPEAHNFRYQLGTVYLEKGDWEKAKLEFEEVIRRNPAWRDITMVYKSLGDYYRLKNDLDNALAAYQKSVETAAPSPRDYVSFNDLGVAYLDKGNYLKGLIYFCQSLQLFPQAETAINNLNQTTAVIQKEYIDKGIVYQKVTEEFIESAEEKIQFVDKRCSETLCQYLFSFQSPFPEVLPPFLIAAVSLPENTIVPVKNSSFDPQQRMIMVQIDETNINKKLSFIFPTCQGIYYREEVEPDHAK